MAQVAVIGAGSWGTALSVLLGRSGHRVRLWSRNERVASQIRRDRVNREYLAGIEVPETVDVELGYGEALANAEFAVMVVPSHALRDIVEGVAPHVPESAVVISGTKGIEEGTLRRPSEILQESLPDHPPVALSGPSFAREVAQGLPTAVTAASNDPDSARRTQALFTGERFRVYTNDDLLGVELAAALKNVIALATGIADGLGYGHNSRAALITRGLAEVVRLGTVMGARSRTFSGLAGLGDLVLTCTGDLSRNRTVGLRLGRGEDLEEILSSMKMVAEGIRTARAARRLARDHGVEMPIVEEVHALLFEGKSAERATADLMLREPKSEYWGTGHGS